MFVLSCWAVLPSVDRALAGEDWTERELRILESLSLVKITDPPVSVSNQFADMESAREFGERLFFDARFSSNGKVSCATCHLSERYFTDGLPRSKGIGRTLRNAPTLVGAAYNSWFYWDGRRDSLWAQALIPIEAPEEMGGSRAAAVRLVSQDPDFRHAYEEIFGPIPEIVSPSELPDQAGPYGGKAMRDTWYRLPREQQLAVNRVFSNLGKAIAAFERTLQPRMTRFDRYVQAATLGRDEPGKSGLMTADEQAGARLFIDSERTQCLQCHNGPLLTNGGFHNIGTGKFAGEELDFGRVFGLRAVLMDEFNCLGPYSDADPPDCLELKFLNKDGHVPLEGAFKVPGLRNLAETAPYFHDGRHATLDDVLQHYQDMPSRSNAPPHELKPLDLSDDEIGQLIGFLLVLSDHGDD